MKYLNVLVFINLSICLSGCALFWPKIVYCPGGDPVAIYRDPYLAYASYVDEYNVSVNGVKTRLMEVAGGLGVDNITLGNKIYALQEKLGQENILHQNNLKAIVMANNARPCDSTIKDRLYNFLDESKARKNELLQIQIKLLTADTQEDVAEIISDELAVEDPDVNVKKK